MKSKYKLNNKSYNNNNRKYNKIGKIKMNKVINIIITIIQCLIYKSHNINVTYF